MLRLASPLPRHGYLLGCSCPQVHPLPPSFQTQVGIEATHFFPFLPLFAILILPFHLANLEFTHDEEGAGS